MNKKLYSSPLAEVFQLEAANSICQASMSSESVTPSTPIDWGWTNYESIF